MIPIPGLHYYPNFLDASQEVNLIEMVDHQPWLTDLKRRVQHYGYKYDYKARKVLPEMYLGPLPDWLVPLSHRLHDEGLMPNVPDQVIINEYHPGQGISPHVDCESCFTDTIASLSLGSHCVMRYTHTDTEELQELLFEPRSLIVLSGEARYDWQHSIPARKADLQSGEEKRQRHRRLSLTFRNVIL